jgi:Putative beta-barrel porin 2
MTEFSLFTAPLSRLAIVCGLAVATLCAASWTRPALATDWTVSGQLRTGVEYDDNIYLSNVNKTSTWRYSADPSVTVSGANERNKLDLTGSGHFEQLDGVAGRNINEYGVSLDDSYAATERLSLGVNGSAEQRSLLTSEIDDTGNLIARGHVRHLRGGASVSYALSATDRISLSGNYQNVAYNNAVFVDYANYQTSLGWQKQISDRVSVITTVSGAIENPKSPVVPVSRYGQGTIGLSYTASELTTLSIYGGSYYLDNGILNGFGVSAGVNGAVKYEFTTISLSVSHGVSPSGTGQFVQNTTGDLSFSQRLSQHLYLDADAAIRFNKSQGGTLFALDRLYYNGQTALRWEFAQHFGLSGYYRYSRQRVLNGAPWAEANRIGVNLVMYTEPRE